MRLWALILLVTSFGEVSYCQPLLSKSIYLNDSKVSDNAKNFYRGKFKESDDEKTTSIIDSLATSNNQTRPFYLFLVSKMLLTRNAALAEQLGLACKEFAEQNPNALLSFFYSKNIDNTLFDDWVEVISGEFQIQCEQKEYHCVDSSFKVALKNCNPKNTKKLSDLYNSIRRSILERTIIEGVLNLPEVQKEIQYVESASKGKTHLGAAIVRRPSKASSYYWVKVWEDNGMSYVSHFNFFVDPNTLLIKYLDTVNDTLLDLKTWRHRTRNTEK